MLLDDGLSTGTSSACLEAPLLPFLETLDMQHEEVDKKEEDKERMGSAAAAPPVVHAPRDPLLLLRFPSKPRRLRRAKKSARCPGRPPRPPPILFIPGLGRGRGGDAGPAALRRRHPGAVSAVFSAASHHLSVTFRPPDRAALVQGQEDGGDREKEQDEVRSLSALLLSRVPTPAQEAPSVDRQALTQAAAYCHLLRATENRLVSEGARLRARGVRLARKVRELDQNAARDEE